METNFNEIKQEILRRAKKAGACKDEYSRAYAAETLSELSQVIKDNFYWVCDNGILTVDLIEQYKEDFAANDIYVNQNVKNGYLLCHNATVKAYGNSIVEAYGNATVVACNYTTVEAYDRATVEAYGDAEVKAYDNAYCTSYHTINCKLLDHAIYRVQNTNTIYYADTDIINVIMLKI